jgi:O-acetyl-ADP-ribose deacetylase (regulator of RNase III)
LEAVLLTYKQGDVTRASEQVIAHGVNCRGYFGSGVAGAIKKRYPYVSDQYLSLDHHILGTCQFVEYQDQIWVNAHTQQDIGRDGGQYADLEAVGECLYEISEYMDKHELTSIAMPRIGCGLGGLKWSDVEVLVDGILGDYEVSIYELE